MQYLNFRQQGITLVEVVVAISIITIMMVAISFSVTAFVDARAQLLHDTRATYLSEEGYEILRALRDDNWNTLDALSLNTVHYLSVATTTITVSATQEVIDGQYYRSFELTEVYRDSDDDIKSSTTPGVTIDPDILEVTVSVFGPTGTTSLTGILSNLHAI